MLHQVKQKKEGVIQAILLLYNRQFALPNAAEKEPGHTFDEYQRQFA
jgi:hypothetical protein